MLEVGKKDLRVIESVLEGPAHHMYCNHWYAVGNRRMNFKQAVRPSEVVIGQEYEQHIRLGHRCEECAQIS